MSDNQPASANRAVFLSYASQDAEAARRICDSLRAAGVEVWFDADGGLEHGDEWDAKIRRQIKECVLFIPLISANTQARHEGYFRLEWELAAERAMSIASGVPFILPVVIDDTLEPDALVPDRFRKVQWTRLPGGVISPDVQARLLKLWSHRVSLVSQEGKRAGAREERSSHSAIAPAPTRNKPSALIATVAVAAVALTSWWFSRNNATSPPSVATAPKTTAGAKPASPLALAESDKSVAVLPLENLSPDPENAFFTDGIHSEIIATLARLSDVKVIARSSTMAFKGTTEPLAVIARQLGVAHLITGSVRREAGHARIVLELRRASDEALLWTQTFDRELKGILAIQSDIASEVARVLSARNAVSHQELARALTQNPRAFDLYQQAEFASDGDGRDLAKIEATIARLEQVMRLDPGYLAPARTLSFTHAYASAVDNDPAGSRRHADAALRWAEMAARLAPGGLGDGPLSYYYSFVARDHTRGLEYAERAIRALPNESNSYNLASIALRFMGRQTEALARLDRALAVDPLNASFLYNRASALADLRRVPESRADLDRFASLTSGRADPQPIAEIRWRLEGSLPSLDGMNPRRQTLWLTRGRRFVEALVQADLGLASTAFGDLAKWNLVCLRCDLLRRVGRADEVTAAAAAAVALSEKLATSTGHGQAESDLRLATAYACAGRATEAVAAARRGIDATPAVAAADRWNREIELAAIHAVLGQTRECVTLLAKLLRVPCQLSVAQLRADPIWDNVRDNPEFKALLADPKNSAPL